MKIAVIYTSFNTADLVPLSLTPWVEARATKLDGHEFLIAAVSVPFEGFSVGEVDATQGLLHKCKQANEIDWTLIDYQPMKETAARGRALQWAKDQDADCTIMVDSDEPYTLEQISRIFAFVAKRPDIVWWRICLKNYVFDDKTYLADPFTPPRIHRLKTHGYKAHSFSDDNDMCYGGTITRDIISQDRFASKTVPKNVAWVTHLTWLNDDRSRRKVEYQLKRWGHCGFKWTDMRLVFDEAYYAKMGQSLPKVLHEAPRIEATT